MGRILSIDYGQKRTGIAVTDPLQIIAGGLVTVATHEIRTFLVDYISKEDVELIVVGEPYQTTGQPSENLNRVKGFVSWLKVTFSEIPVVTYDERFTTVLAHKAMIDGGLKKKTRQNKALVDEISATILLQSYLEARLLKK